MKKAKSVKPFFVWKILALVFFCIGLPFLCVGIGFAIHDSNLESNYKSVEAVISEFSHGKVRVDYDVEGERYSSTINYRSSSFEEGDPITIYYKPSRPEKATVKMPILLWTFLITGAAFVIAGILIFMVLKKKQHDRKALIENGEYIRVKISEIRLNKNVQYNNKNPYFIICRYTGEDGKIWEFKSDALLENPEELLMGDTVTIYYDRLHPKRYYMDLEEILKPSQL